MRFSAFALICMAAACAKPLPPEQKAQFERLSSHPLEHGERLSAVLGCSGCHGKDLAGRDWSDELGTLWTGNLTRAAAEMSDAEFKATLVSGHRPGGRELWEMPSHLFTQLTSGELDAVVAFVRSKPVTGPVHPPPSFGPKLKQKMAEGLYRSSAAEVRKSGNLSAPAAGADHALARHITRATCAECHGIDLEGKTNPIDGRISPDIRMMAAGYSAADFDRLLTTGVASSGQCGPNGRGRQGPLRPPHRDRTLRGLPLPQGSGRQGRPLAISRESYPADRRSRDRPP